MISCLLSQTTKLLKGLRNLKELNLLVEELIHRLSFKISPFDKATKKKKEKKNGQTHM